MSKIKIILFSGKAECGKTTASKMAMDSLTRLGYRVVKLSYAEYVKQTAKMLFGWNGEKDEAGRELLQWWGTDKVRAQSPDFWVDTVIRLVGVIDDMYDFVVIDDVRFENELNRWGNYTTYSIRVERPDHISALTKEQLEHISETALDNYQFDIRLVARDMKELSEQVESVLIPQITGSST